MDVTSKKRKARYDRVMPRVYSKTRVNSKPSFSVTRHESPTPRVGGKPSVLNATSSVISDLPLVLDDYVPEEKSPKRTFVVKPRRTLKSLEPVKPPVQSVPVAKLPGVRDRSRNIRVPVSMPSVLDPDTVGWSESHVRQCYSSRSHTKLQELKSEIKEYKKKEDLLKFRSRLHKHCGVVLDDAGQVAADKAVQAAGLDSPSSNNRKKRCMEENSTPDKSEETGKDFHAATLPTAVNDLNEGTPSVDGLEIEQEAIHGYQEETPLVDILEIKEEKIQEMSTSNDEAEKQSSKISEETLLQEPLPLRLLVIEEMDDEVYDGNEREDLQANLLPAQPVYVNNPAQRPLLLEVPSLRQTHKTFCPDVLDDQFIPLTELPKKFDEYDKFALNIAANIRNLSDVGERVNLLSDIQSIVDRYVTRDMKNKLPNTSFSSSASIVPGVSETASSAQNKCTPKTYTLLTNASIPSTSAKQSKED